MSRLTIFEGPDGGGKTTAAQRWARQTGAFYTHFGPTPGVGTQFARMHVEAMLPALLNCHDVVLDRAWMSEPIYGAIYRDGQNRIPRQLYRLLDRLAARCETRVVLCKPSIETCLVTWEKRAEEEYLDTEEQLRGVYELYDRQITLGQFTDLPWEIWDYTKPWDRFGSKSSRTIAHQTSYNTTGFIDAPIIIVDGEPPTLSYCDNKTDFASITFSQCTSHHWMTSLLESGGITEKDLLWVNYDDPQLSKIWIEFPFRKAIIGLGDLARHAVELSGYLGRFYQLPHPNEEWCKPLKDFDIVGKIREALANG
jgi:hypothetical protein